MNLLILKVRDETIELNRKASEDFFLENENKAIVLNEFIEAYRGILDLTPQDLTDFTSGKMLPFLEGDIELSAVISLAERGYYRIAFSTLRNVLELALVAIYYDRSNNSAVEIANWVRSRENTPFHSKLVEKIFRISNFSNFKELKTEVQNLYWELSNFNHTKGIKYSNRKLGSPTHVGSLTFNKETLEKIISTTEEVVRCCLFLYSIKYPVASFEVPIFKKFGFNRPIGHFLDERHVVLWKKLIGSPYREKIESFAQANEEALSMYHSVLGMPDLDEQKLEDQYFDMQKISIASMGYMNWLSMHDVIMTPLPDDSLERVTKLKDRELRFREWAKENGCFDRALTLQEMQELQKK